MRDKNKFIRIIDANLNRSREGLRVCEDVVRFLYDDDILIKKLKEIRHKIKKIIKKSRYDKRILTKYRDVEQDKGKDSGTKGEFSREGEEEIFESNIKRAQEALRVLEEITKVEEPQLADALKSIRFEVYEVEKKFFEKI